MKAIGISGSPRENGNTSTLVKRCLGALAQHSIKINFVSLSNKHVSPCTACNVCRHKQDGTCAIKDDDFHEIFNLMLEADIIITGSPVYFGSATPQMMSLLDRAGYVARPENRFSRKIGGPIAVARRAGHNFTYAQLMYWYMINDMIVPGSSYWNVGLGKAQEEVKDDDEALATIDRFSENLIWLSKKINNKNN